MTESPQGFECTFCHKVMRYESAFIKHLCRDKKRFLDRDRQHIRFAYMAYRLFFDVGFNGRKKSPTQEEFEKSPVYDAFVRFGQHIVDLNAISPEEFTRFLIASKVRVDFWCREEHYRSYVRALTKHEDGRRALERNVNLMHSWANQKEGRDTRNFFRDISPALAIQWIVSGRISPWVVFNCTTGQEMMKRLSPEQYSILTKAIEVKFWMDKFAKNKDDVAFIQEFLEEEGM